MWRLMRQRLTGSDFSARRAKPLRKRCFTWMVCTHYSKMIPNRRKTHVGGLRSATLGRTDSLRRRTSTLAPMVLDNE
jgi:hypothetical protein